VTHSLRDQTAIVGVGNSKFGRFPVSYSPLSMVVDAFRDALADSGLRKSDVDGIIINIGTPLGVDYDQVAEGLGLDILMADETWTHGRQLAGVLAHAALAVDSGLANVVACVCAINWSRGGTVGSPGQNQDTREIGGAHFESPAYGMASPGGAFALATQTYFDRYGASGEDLARVAVTFRHHASLNPLAVRQDEITVADHQASKFICEPLRLLDYCQTTGGGCVILVARADMAGDCRKPPVYLSGFQGMRAGRKEATGARPGLGIHQQSLAEPVPNPRDLAIYQAAGIEQDAIDALFTYDAMSPAVWMALERFGFCPEGEAWQFTNDGHIALGGRLPMNTNGGLLSETHVSSWNHICEIVRQLRNECGPRQIENAEVIQWATNRGDSVIFRK
jgi:acetyl-CoA acetyltransferase